jgi:hypothetical protein
MYLVGRLGWRKISKSEDLLYLAHHSLGATKSPYENCLVKGRMGKKFTAFEQFMSYFSPFVRILKNVL